MTARRVGLRSRGAVLAAIVSATSALVPGAVAALEVELKAAAGVVVADPAQEPQKFIATTCTAIETEAKRRALPPAYFARLIWKESRFNPGAISPKGASGIAQFMPGTARERGLADPFDPKTALAASAAYLHELRLQFGNLGLAAAAYNAGPDRVARWRDGGSYLPWETHDFVLSITGLTAEQWRTPDVAAPDFALHETLPFVEACQQFASRARPMARAAAIVASTIKPWGVLVASHVSEAKARAALNRLRQTHAVIAQHQTIDFARRPNAARGGHPMFQVMLGVDHRGAGDELCNRLRRAGGACMVVRN